MSTFEDLIRLENANSAVAFRERPYGGVERQALVRDIIALANAAVNGPRFVFMGVRDVLGGERKVVGISPEAYAEARELYRALIARFVEPPIEIRLRSVVLDGVTVGVLQVDGCDDPPYLLKESVSNTMRRGSGWIRRGTEPMRLDRSDLQRMFERKFLGPALSIDVRVGFMGKVPQEELILPVLELDELPSAVAGERIRTMLDAKKTTKDVFGRTETRIDRLVHAQLFGENEPYERHTSESLLERLERTEEDFKAADDYYRFELRAHKVDLVLANLGESPLDGAVLTLDIARLDGTGVSEKILSPPGESVGEGYPVVDIGARTIRVQCTVGKIPQGATVKAFRQPLRLWVREAAVKQTIPIYYSLHGRSLREPITGTLRIHVADHQRAAETTKKPAVAGRSTGF